MCLAVAFTQPRTAPNDLLKLCHGADHLIQHNQLCHFAVRAGGQQLGGRGNHRVRLRNRNEVFELAFPIFVAACDTHDIIRVFLHHIGVEVDQRNTHPLRGVLRGTEHDGLCHAVSRFQIIGDLPCHLFDPFLNDNVIVIITVVIHAILNEIAEFVTLTVARPPSVANVQRDIDDLEGR